MNMSVILMNLTLKMIMNTDVMLFAQFLLFLSPMWRWTSSGALTCVTFLRFLICTAK